MKSGSGPGAARAMLIGWLCAASAVPATAETIYGSLTGPGGPVRGHLMLTCNNQVAQTDADERGSYRLTIAARGRCWLRVNDMQSPGELVFVYEEPTRYDYQVRIESGTTRIVRR